MSFILFIIFLILSSIFIYDRYIQKTNIIVTNFPILGRFRYFFHDLRPFFRQYFGDDNAFVNRMVIDWINQVSSGKSGYFSFDKFDTSGKLHSGGHQMIHSNNPINDEDMKPIYPTIGAKRRIPMQMESYLYKSAMSLGSISFEATQAMASACQKSYIPFNTGEGSLSVHHIPNVKFEYKKKYFKYIKIPKIAKLIHKTIPSNGLKIRYIRSLANRLCTPELSDLYLLDSKKWLFYTIDWDADLKHFPSQKEKSRDFGQIILQIGSALYGLRDKDDSKKVDWERYKKIMSFCSAVEVKLAQGAKQTGGVLKAIKNTESIAKIRGINPGVDLNSPNRFPFYQKGSEGKFFSFLEKLSSESAGKPVGIKITVSDESNINSLAKSISQYPKKAPDFITVDGGDGGTGSAPIALGVLFGKTIYESLEIVNKSLKKYKVRDRVSVLASSKLYAPHMSARALALGADAIGNARSIMISGGCIRAGVCSGENGTCPVGMATMNKSNRLAYAQNMESKINQISNYISGHNKGIIQVAAVSGLTSPSELSQKNIAKPRIPVRL